MIFTFLRKFIKRTPTTRTIFFITNDLIFIPLSFYLAFFLRFEGAIPKQYNEAIAFVVLVALGTLIPIFYFSKLYSFSWSYVSTDELISLAKANIIGFSLIGALLFLLKNDSVISGFPRSTLFVSFFLIILFCGGIRFSKRVYLRTLEKRVKVGKEKTLIVGAGDAGEQILRSILSSKSHFLPIGFVDDSLMKEGVLIHGLKVLGKISEIPKIVKENKIETIIIALPSVGSEVIKEAIEKGREAGLKSIKVIPSLVEIVDGSISVANLKDIQVEDLLGRKPVSLDYSSIKNIIEDRKVLVTGAAGSIGSELCRQVAKFEPALIVMLDQDETGIFNISEELKDKYSSLNLSSEICDIQDEKKIRRIFSKIEPQIVFHAAAYKHVPLMERHPDEAIKNNVLGTNIVAEASLMNNVERFIFISTDKAVKPSSVMGASKRLGEMICQSLNGKGSTAFISVRFGNVLDSRGSCIPVFKEQIRNGGPVRVTHPEMKRYFMMISEACILVMQAATIGKGGEVFVLDMGEPIKILDLAKELIRLSGLEPDKDIPIVFTKPRPGEKLCEEILGAEEGTIESGNKKILIARLSEVEKDNIHKVLEELKQTIGEKDRIVQILRESVPYYNPNS